MELNIVENPNHFINLRSKRELLNYLKLGDDEFSVLINVKFNKFRIPKKSGGIRIIQVPPENLKHILKTLSQDLLEIYDNLKPPNVFGYIKAHELNKSILIRQHANLHVGKQWLINFDLENFFNSITREAVQTIFNKAPFCFPDLLCEALAKLTTYNNCLPIGAPSSPVISNFILSEIDLKMSDISNLYNATYSRYADDITFSFSEKPENEFFLKAVNCITKSGFKVNYKKVNLLNTTHRLEVTGLIVNEKVNIKKEYFRDLKATLYNLNFKDFDEQVTAYVLRYNLGFRRFCIKNLTANFREKYNLKIRFHLNDFSTSYLTELFVRYSLLGKLHFVSQVLDYKNERTQKLWTLYNNIHNFSRRIDQTPKPCVPLAFITNSTANSVIRYAFDYLKHSKIADQKIKEIKANFSDGVNLRWDKLLQGMLNQSVYFIYLYEYLMEHNTFEQFVNSNKDNKQLQKQFYKWGGYERYVQRFYYRQVYHNSPNCLEIRKDYDERDKYLKNTGVYAHTNENDVKAPHYFVKIEFLKKLKMRLCKTCSKLTLN